MRKRIILISLFLLSPIVASADRTLLPVQGYVISKSTGDPLEGSFLCTFRIYNAESGGDPLVTSSQILDLDEGIYSTSIDVPISVISENDIFLGVTIGDDSEMTPRLEYFSTPYAKIAEMSDTCDVATTALNLSPDNLSNIIGSGLKISGGDILLDTGTAPTWTAKHTFAHNPADTTSANAVLQINPGTSDANDKFLAIRDNGTDRFTVDKEGDVTIAGNLTVSGTATITGIGDITSVTAGSGLTGGGLTGDLTLTVGAGNAITVNADDVAVSTNSINEEELGATITLADADFFDLASIIHDDTALQGLRLPQIGASPTSPTSGEGFIGWDQTNNTLEYYNGTSWVAVGTGSGTITGVTAGTGMTGGGSSGSVTLSIDTGGVSTTQILDNTITATDLNATLTFADADLIDLSAILHDDATNQGIKLPQGTASPTVLTSAGEGQMYWETDADTLHIFNGLTWTSVSNPFGSAIDSSEITDGTIATGDIATDTILAGNIAAGAVGTSEIADGVVSTTDILDATIVSGDIAVDTILAGNIAAGGVATSEILDNTITATDLNATITFADADLVDLSAILHDDATNQGIKLPQGTASPTNLTGAGEGQVYWETDADLLHIYNGASWTAVSNPFGSAIDTGEITDGTIAAADIAAGTITTTEIAVDTIAAADIAAGAVGTSELADGVIAAADLDITMTPAWTGLHSWTTTVTATGSIQDVNLTLGNDADVDTVSGINIDTTSAATADADVVYGLNVGNLTSADATVLERAIRIGSGWDEALDVNGTLISLTELQALDAGIESADIAVDTIVAADIATGAVTTTEILDGTVAAADIAAGTITTTEIATDTIAAADIAADAVGEPELKVISGDTAADEECLTYESTNGDFEWQTCGSGSTAFDAIGDPTGAGAVAMAETAQTLDWNTANTAAAFDGLSVTLTNDATTDANTQRAVVIQNKDAAGSTATERLLVLDNADTTEAVTTALEILVSGNSTATITTAIDASDTEITTALSVGANDIVGTTGLINYDNFDVDASGNVDAAGTITAGSGNEIITLATGKIDADAIGLNSADGAGLTSSGSGMETGGDKLGLIQGCADKQVLKWDDTNNVWQCGSDRGTVHVRKTAAEEVDNSATLQDDDALTFAVGANEDWVVIFYIIGEASTTPDWKFAVTAPASSTCNYVTGSTMGSSDTATSGSSSATATCGGTITQGGGGTDNYRVHLVYGTFSTAGTAGSVTLQWAQNTATASSISTVAAGSFLTAYKTSGADFAELYYTKDNTLMPGEVVVLDPDFSSGVRRSSQAYDKDLLGIYSTQPGQVIGGDRSGALYGRPIPIAMSGRVPVKATTENGPIEPGDYLTTSSTPGAVMRATKSGVVVGKALTPLNEAEGVLVAFVEQGYQGWDEEGLTQLDDQAAQIKELQREQEKLRVIVLELQKTVDELKSSGK